MKSIDEEKKSTKKESAGKQVAEEFIPWAFKAA
jgi:hypothetical protein